MDITYKVTVNENSAFDLTKNDIDQLDVLPIGPNSFHILLHSQPFHVEVLASDLDKKKYSLKVNNNTYTVSIADNLDLLIKDMGFASGSTESVTSIWAPMPGLILEINVKEGQEVQEDDSLLILEAMKMENVITSPRNGTIKSISVSQGDTVEKKSLLIEFE